MKNKSTLISTVSFIALLSLGQNAMALNEESAGYDLILNKAVSQDVTPHNELSSLNGNLEDAMTYGALYQGIATPLNNSDQGHGAHDHSLFKVSYMLSSDEANSNVLVGDPFYYDTSR